MAIYKYGEVKDGDSIRMMLLKAITKNGVIIGWEPCFTPEYAAKPEYAKQEEVDVIKDWKQEQESVIPDNVVKGIKEIENFLMNVSDNKTLEGLLTTLTESLTAAIAAKEDRIQDLATIRSNAEAGATAVQQSDLAAFIDSVQMDEDTGDITIEYDNGEETENE